jgi:hypothetical protein
MGVPGVTAELEPRDRARHGCAGRPVRADGKVWLIPDAPACPALDETRDTLHDQAVKERAVDVGEIEAAALCLLRINYDIDITEALAVVTAADTSELTHAVMPALLGPNFGDAKRRTTYSMWVRVSLLANGIEPASLPPADLYDVLDTLVRTGRALPSSQFCDVTKWVKERDALLQQAGDW